MRYKDVETALAELMNVRPTDMGAFRGRLRHLRNIGLPRLPQSGSGRAINYSPRHVLAMFLALQFEEAGQTAGNAALVAESIVRQLPHTDGEDCYVCIIKEQAGYTMVSSKKAFLEFLNSAPDAFLVINISGCVKKLKSALSRSILVG